MSATITPTAIKAAWVEVRRWWPRKVVEVVPCKACGAVKGYRVVETAILVDEPAPGFREAVEAALEFDRVKQP
jgi:hypothetical protein